MWKKIIEHSIRYTVKYKYPRSIYITNDQYNLIKQINNANRTTQISVKFKPFYFIKYTMTLIHQTSKE